MTSRFIVVTGSCPGIGKSTLSREFASILCRSGVETTLFREGDILDHPSFASVATKFRQTGDGDPSDLLTASAHYLSSYGSSGAQVHVIDSLFPCVTSLLAWGYPEEVIRDFIRDLWLLLAPLDTVTIYVDGDPDVALARAGKSRGDSWTTAFLARAATWKLARGIVDQESAVAHFQYERGLTVRLLAETGWPITVVDSISGSAAEVLDATLRAVGARRQTSCDGKTGRV